MSAQESTLITGIGELVTNDGEHGGFAARKDAALVIADGTLPADLEPLVELVTRGTLTPAA